MTSFSLLVVVIFLTLAFEFSNGWHDAANSIATVVSTRVLTPLRAVAWAAFWNFIAAFVFGTAVASTIGKGMIHIEMVTQQVLLAGLLGAISWNLITLTLGLPTSSSHALIGGFRRGLPPPIPGQKPPAIGVRQYVKFFFFFFIARQG